MPRYVVRSRETRVYQWTVEAKDTDEAEQIVLDYGGDTTEADDGDQFDSTEILDVTPAAPSNRTPFTRGMLEQRFATRAGLYDNDARWLLDRVEEYPYLACAPTAINPLHYRDIDHASNRLSAGWRLWLFKRIEDRDNFITSGAGHEF